MKYILTLENYAGMKEYTNLDNLFKSLRKIIKNQKDNERLKFGLAKK